MPTRSTEVIPDDTIKIDVEYDDDFTHPGTVVHLKGVARYQVSCDRK